MSPDDAAATPTAIAVGLPVDYDSKAFWDGCRRHELLITHCGACDLWIHPPRRVCPRCWSDSVVPRPVSGRGTVFTFVIEGRGSAARVVATIELAEQAGLRLVAAITGDDAAQVDIGAAVALRWIEYQGLPVPAFVRWKIRS